MNAVQLLQEARLLQQADETITLSEALEVIKSLERIESDRTSKEGILKLGSDFAEFTHYIVSSPPTPQNNLYIFQEKSTKALLCIKAPDRNTAENAVIGNGMDTRFIDTIYAGQITKQIVIPE